MKATTSSTAPCRTRATCQRWAPRSKRRSASSSTACSSGWLRSRCSATTTGRSNGSARVELLLLALTHAQECLSHSQACARKRACHPCHGHAVARYRQDDLVAVKQLHDLVGDFLGRVDLRAAEAQRVLRVPGVLAHHPCVDQVGTDGVDADRHPREGQVTLQ